MLDNLGDTRIFTAYYHPGQSFNQKHKGGASPPFPKDWSATALVDSRIRIGFDKAVTSVHQSYTEKDDIKVMSEPEDF